MSSPPGPPPGGDRPQASGAHPDSPTLWHPASEWPDGEDDEDGEDDVDFQPESEHSGDIPELEDESVEDEEPDSGAAASLCFPSLWSHCN